MTQAPGVFDGLTVLDLSRWVPGEYAAKMFGDFGADVIKVERTGEGSLTRSYGPFPGDEFDREASMLFLHLNTNKKSVELDLASSPDRDSLLDLVRDADLVVESFRPGTMEKLGLSYQDLAKVNPNVVMTRISSFGQDGRYRDREASSLVLQALGGPMHATGAADRRPHRKPGLLPLYIVGRCAAEASLAGLMHARRRKTGTEIDVSAHEVLLFGGDRRAAYLQVAAYSGTNAPRGIRSAHRGTVLPTGPYRVKDGYVMLYVASHFLTAMVKLLGDDALIAYFGDGKSLLNDPQEANQKFHDVLYPWLAARTKREVMTLAQDRHIPITAILSVDEVMADEHFQQREAFVPLDHPVVGTLKYAGPPFRMQRGGFELRRSAPRLGEHNVEILGSRSGVTEMAR